MNQSIRSEILAHWNIQENLLQQYRIMGMTHQAIIAAAILLVIGIFEQNSKYILFYSNYIGDDRAYVGALLVIKIILYISLLSYGWYGTFKYTKITKDRGQHVTLFQNLLLMCESGRFDYWMERFGTSDSLPFLTILRNFQGNPNCYDEYGIGIKLSAEAKEFINFNKSVANDKGRHHITRAFLSKNIFFMFHVIWIFCMIYLFAFIFSIFGVSISIK